VVNVSRSTLSEALPNEAAFQREFLGTEWIERNYRAGGDDQLCLRVDGLETAQRVVADPHVIRAGAELNLRSMRKGGNIYAHYHCFVADRLLGGTTS
jgi:hypothetical protein